MVCDRGSLRQNLSMPKRKSPDAGVLQKRTFIGAFDRIAWIAKYASLSDDTVSAQGFRRADDGMVEMQCVSCLVWKDRTADNFRQNNVTGSVDEWFAKPWVSLQNTPGVPCRSCFRQGLVETVRVTRTGPPEKKPRRMKNYIERDAWIEKYASVSDDAVHSKGLRRGADGIVEMQCVGCGEWKERTTDYFLANGVNGDLSAWFQKEWPWFQMGKQRPCKTCIARKLAERYDDVDGDGWIRHIMLKYTSVHEPLTDAEKEQYKISNKTSKRIPKTDHGIRWANTQYTSGRCAVTGFTLPFQKIKRNAFSMSVNGKHVQPGKYTQRHAADDIEPVLAFANCPQSVEGEYDVDGKRTKVVIIPSLRDAFAQLYTLKIKTYTVGNAATMAEGTRRAAHMTVDDFKNVTMHGVHKDKLQGLENDQSLTPTVVLERVRSQHGLCCITGVPFTTRSTNGGHLGPFDMHCDRIEDATNSDAPKGHVLGNVEFKIRLLNNRYQLTKKDFLLVFLNQNLVPLPDDVRALAQADYDAEPRSPRDQWPLHA